MAGSAVVKDALREEGVTSADHATAATIPGLLLIQTESKAIASRRKLIGFDAETLQALDLLSRDSGKSMQDLADEAFADLLAKHHRPHTLKEALKQSSRGQPANENKPQKRPNVPQEHD